MAGKRSAKTNPSQARKRVEAVDSKSASTLVRGKDGSAFARCGECNKDVPVALISMHSCSLEAKITMNLEAQVVENPTEVKKPAERKKPKSKEPKAKRAKVEKGKMKKDANAPKRPITSFFIFLEDFRKEYKEANPDAKGVKGVAKEAGEKWKSMTDEEKKPYHDKAAELKAEYERAIEAYNAEDEDQDVDEGSDKEAAEKEVEEGEERSDKEAATNELEEVSEEE